MKFASKVAMLFAALSLCFTVSAFASTCPDGYKLKKKGNTATCRSKTSKVSMCKDGYKAVVNHVQADLCKPQANKNLKNYTSTCPSGYKRSQGAWGASNGGRDKCYKFTNPK